MTQNEMIIKYLNDELADEELSGVVPKKVENSNDEWYDIGYYIDENGYKRKGRIPKKNQTIPVTNEFNEFNDYARHRTSDPRSRIGYLS